MNKKNIAIISVVLVVVIGIVLFFLLNNGKKYDVSFDTAGGNTIQTQVVKKGETVTKPADPTRTNYEFINWYLGDEIFDFTMPITKKITLTVKWRQTSNIPIEEEKIVITFDSNGGSKIEALSIKKNSTISKPNTPTRNGYRFISWQLDGKNFDFKTTLTKDTTLIAKWEKISSTTNNNNNNKPEEKKPVETKPVETKPTTISVNSVSISKSTLSLNVGENSTLSATINPSNATNKNISWSSSNINVATVDQNGKVVAVSSGTTTITVTASDKTANCVVTVIKPITYAIDWVKVEDSSMGQYMLYIKSSEGTYVSAIVTITTSAGKVSDVNITSSGKMYIKSAISNAVVKSVN